MCGSKTLLLSKMKVNKVFGVVFGALCASFNVPLGLTPYYFDTCKYTHTQSKYFPKVFVEIRAV